MAAIQASPTASDESNKKYYEEGNKTRINKERQKTKNARTSRKRNRK